MRNYTGDKPCPGCGRKPDESPRTYVDKVCYECKDALRYGYNIKETDDGRHCLVQIDKYSFKHLAWRAGEDFKRSSKPPYLSDTVDVEGSTKHVQQAMVDFIETLDLGKRPDHMATIISQQGSGHGFWIPYSQAKMFWKFYDALGKYAVRLQKEAAIEGTKLLKKLNDGSLTTEDFEDQLERIKQK